MGEPAVVLHRNELGVAVIRLNRPAQRNALDREMFEGLRDAFTSLDPDVRAAVLTGTGRSFCSGAHHEALGEQAQLGAEERRAGIDWVYETLLLPQRLRVPVVTALNGHAIAAGAVLALMGDLVVAAEGAKLGLGFVRLGLYPAVGATWWLPRAVGRHRAFEILALGDVLVADQAKDLGLVNRVVPADCLEEEAMALAERLAAGPPMALSRIKAAINAGASSTLEAALTLDVEYQSACASSLDFQEGLHSVIEQRTPQFDGR